MVSLCHDSTFAIYVIGDAKRAGWNFPSYFLSLNININIDHCVEVTLTIVLELNLLQELIGVIKRAGSSCEGSELLD